MEISFTKYHGTGNDFIMIDDRDKAFPSDNFRFIKKLCHRRFGIGADGLILIHDHPEYDFYMKYFNSDGLEGSMCGNGGRCTVHFARDLGIFSGFTYFMAVDGLHKANIDEDFVSLAMNDVNEIDKSKGYFFLNTGSPHVVKEVKNIDQYNVLVEGRKIRQNHNLFPEGTNVNFIEKLTDQKIKIRTYERGVEDETWSCGTGSVAAALVTSILNDEEKEKYQILLQAPGGNLEVSFKKGGEKFNEIFLKGPATKVFSGKIQID